MSSMSCSYVSAQTLIRTLSTNESTSTIRSDRSVCSDTFGVAHARDKVARHPVHTQDFLGYEREVRCVYGISVVALRFCIDKGPYGRALRIAALS